MITYKFRFGRLAAAVLAISAIPAIDAAPVVAAEDDHKQTIREQVLPKVRAFIADTRVIDAVNTQNARHFSLSQTKIDNLDKQWRAETAAGGGRLVSSLLDNKLSGYLSGVQADSQGLFAEIFVMDNKGLNVGQSGLTSDYWQGDEAKWQDTYGKGADAILIDDVEFDESTQTFQSQVSLPVIDPASGDIIGAITVGVNMDLLQ